MDRNARVEQLLQNRRSYRVRLYLTLPRLGGSSFFRKCYLVALQELAAEIMVACLGQETCKALPSLPVATELAQNGSQRT